MTVPVRLQLSRRKGFNLQAVSFATNGLPAVRVSRPSLYGNPFRIGEAIHRGPSFSVRDELVRDGDHACRLFRGWLFNLRDAEHKISPLRGKNLACWCKPGRPCHADVLLELANG